MIKVKVTKWIQKQTPKQIKLLTNDHHSKDKLKTCPC